MAAGPNRRVDQIAANVRVEHARGISLRVVENLFVVPRSVHKERVAYVAIELVDTAFTASMLDTGRLAPVYVTPARLAAIGFLGHYFGARVPARPLPNLRR